MNQINSTPSSFPQPLAVRLDGVTATWPRTFACYTLMAYITCFHALGSFGIISMEGMVADGARHMLDSGNWFVPYVYQEIYTYKPALAYWLSAFAQTWMPNGLGEFALRAPFAGFVALCGALIMVLVGRELGRKAGLLTAFALLGTSLFSEKVRLAEFDSVLSAAVAVAVVAACLNLAKPRATAGLWFLSYGFLALGFLAKGTPALMAFAPGFGCALLASRKFRLVWAPAHLSAFALFVVSCGSYLFLVYSSAGDSGFQQPLNEAAWRGFAWTGESFLLTLTKPFLILAAFMPWALFAATWRRVEAGSQAGRTIRSAVAFLVGGMFAFVIVPTHEMRYYLPLSGAMALIAGIAAAHVRLSSRAERILWAAVSTLTVLGLSAGWIRYLSIETGSLDVLILITGAGLSALALCGLDRQNRVLRGVVTASLVIALMQATVFVPSRAASRDRSNMAALFDSRLEPDSELWVLGHADAAGKHSSLYYYLGRTTRTFYLDSLPPAGSLVVLVDEQRALLPEARTRTLVESSKAGYDYRLVELLPAP